MTGVGLSGLLRKLAAVAVLLGAVGLAYVLAVAAIQARLGGAGEAIAEQRMLLGRLQSEIARRAGVKRDASPAVLAATANESYLQGESDAVKAARLQAMLKEIAEAAGLRLASTRALPLREAGRLRLIGMEARLDASMSGLQQLLLALEASRPMVLVQALTIAPSAYRANVAVGEGVVEDEPLSIAIEVHGAAPLGPAPDAAASAAGSVMSNGANNDPSSGEARREPLP